MHVRQNNENMWPNSAQPEWPDAASGTRGTPATGDATQAFTETGTRTAAFPDPWEDIHDPHEVTVQLDAVASLPGERLTGRPEGAAADGSDGPVFVDESGRRSRRYRRIGILAGTTCAVYAVVIVATLLAGNSHAPWLPVPDQGEGKEAGRVENPPLPAELAEPTAAGSGIGTGGGRPAVPPAPDDTTTQSPSAGTTTSGASARPAEPVPSAVPQPTETRTTPRTGAGPTPDPEKPTAPSVTGTPDPPTTQEPSLGPPDLPADGSAGPGSGTETVADGASGPRPVAAESPKDPEHTL
ncbi:hypothetical protein [Streptomyces curacoi]|uniref:hypothetical protein n=1 Tax=Streptomyces curacoi TaxID=146536 RepID=UPI000D14CF24|nr:hypothetical protein [Streptomyces curacoi]